MKSWHLIVCCCLLALMPVTALAQGDKKEDEDKIPAPEDITMTTKDGVVLAGTYFGSKLKKKAIPVIMLHGWEGNRTEYDALALDLQAKGFAVLTFDFRGHGGSTKLANGAKVGSLSRMTPRAKGLLTEDVQTAKRFLREKNNAGELNLSALCLIGSEFGATIAVNWTVVDYSWPDYPGIIQGKSVKGLILISPQKTSESVPITLALRNPVIRAMPTLIVVGGDSPRDFREAKNIHDELEKFHPDYVKEKTPLTERRLFFYAPKTRLQGAKMLDPRVRLSLDKKIVLPFLNLRFLRQMDQPGFKWAHRGSKAPE